LAEDVLYKQHLLVFRLLLRAIDWAASLLLLLLFELLKQRHRVAAQQHDEHHQHQRSDAAPHQHRAAHAPAVLDVLAAGSLLPSHGGCSWRGVDGRGRCRASSRPTGRAASGRVLRA